MPFRRSSRRRAGRWLPLVLGLYALILVGSPALHHDLACHLKSPTHCDACTANPLASRIEVGVSLDEAPLVEAEGVESEGPRAPRPIVAFDASGRAPPA